MTIVLPILFTLYAIYKRKFIPFILGVAAFTLSQMVIRIPLLNILAKESSTYQLWTATKPIVILIFLAFSAGLFEEMARFVAIKFFIKKQTIHNGIIFGLGHGGIEALLIVGIPVLLNQLIAAQSYELYLSGFERLCAIAIHVCLSIIVLLAVKKRTFRYVIYAIIIHGIINFTISFVSMNVTLFVAEAIFGVLTALLVVIIYIMCRRINKNEKDVRNCN